MHEDIFTLLLIIWSAWSQALAHCFRFWQVGVVIIMILRASVLSADEKPESNFYARFYTVISSFEMSEFEFSPVNLLFRPITICNRRFFFAIHLIEVHRSTYEKSSKI